MGSSTAKASGNRYPTKWLGHTIKRLGTTGRIAELATAVSTELGTTAATSTRPSIRLATQRRSRGRSSGAGRHLRKVRRFAERESAPRGGRTLLTALLSARSIIIYPTVSTAYITSVHSSSVVVTHDQVITETTHVETNYRSAAVATTRFSTMRRCY